MLATATAAWADLTPEPGSPYPTGPGPYGVYAADFNGDGRPDLATAQRRRPARHDVSVYPAPAGRRLRSRSPARRSPAARATARSAISTATDVPTSPSRTSPSSGVAILIRNAGGGFSRGAVARRAARGPATSPSATSTATARPDLAIANCDTATTSRSRLRNGPTTPASTRRRTIATGVNPRAGRASRDFDGDGDDDLAIANAASGNVVLLRNAAAGLRPGGPAGTPVGDAPSGIVAADFDGNGRPDLAVANASSSTVSVLLRNAAQRRLHATGPARRSRSAPARAGSPPPTSTATAARHRRRLHERARHGAAQLRRWASPRDAPTRVDREPDRRRGRATSTSTACPDAAVSLARHQPAARAAQPSPPRSRPRRRRRRRTPPPTLDAPKAGEVNLLPVKGKVKVKLKGSKTYVDLKEGIQVKAGASVDTRKGTVTIVGPGSDDKANFFDGLFQISQSKGLTTLTLTEALTAASEGQGQRRPRSPRPASCGATARASSAPRASTARPPCAAPSGSSPTPAPRRRRKVTQGAVNVRGLRQAQEDDRCARASATRPARRSARSACVSGGPLRHFGKRRVGLLGVRRLGLDARAVAAARSRRACRPRCPGARARRP